MTQLGLSYTPPFDARLDWARVVDAVRAAVNRLGVKEVAHALDVAPSTLCEALADREEKGRKRLALEWLCTILRMAADIDRLAILEAIAIPVGYVPQRRRVMTPEEEVAHLRRVVGRVAPIALEVADKEMGR